MTQSFYSVRFELALIPRLPDTAFEGHLCYFLTLLPSFLNLLALRIGNSVDVMGVI